jgi:hypothetical protein
MFLVPAKIALRQISIAIPSSTSAFPEWAEVTSTIPALATTAGTMGQNQRGRRQNQRGRSRPALRSPPFDFGAGFCCTDNSYFYPIVFHSHFFAARNSGIVEPSAPERISLRI